MKDNFEIVRGIRLGEGTDRRVFNKGEEAELAKALDKDAFEDLVASGSVQVIEAAPTPHDRVANPTSQGSGSSEAK